LGGGEKQVARARNLKPGFFKNELLAECSFAARLLFEGLWTLADREGRLEDRPKRIRSEIFPYDNVDIDQLLNELADQVEQDGKPAFILRYIANGISYIQVLNFFKHQNPHKKEATSTIPAPDLYSASTVQEPDSHSATTVQEPNNHDAGTIQPPEPTSEEPSKIKGLDEHHTSTVLAPDLHATSPAESLLLNPYSLNPLTPIPESGARTGQEKVVSEIFTLVEQTFGLINDSVRSKVLDIISHYPRDWIVESIHEAQGKRHISYAEVILSRWRSEGYKDWQKPWEEEKQREKHQRGYPGSYSKGKAGTRPSPVDWENEPDHL